MEVNHYAVDLRNSLGMNDATSQSIENSSLIMCAQGKHYCPQEVSLAVHLCICVITHKRTVLSEMTYVDALHFHSIHPISRSHAWVQNVLHVFTLSLQGLIPDGG